MDIILPNRWFTMVFQIYAWNLSSTLPLLCLYLASTLLLLCLYFTSALSLSFDYPTYSLYNLYIPISQIPTYVPVTFLSISSFQIL